MCPLMPQHICIPIAHETRNILTPAMQFYPEIKKFLCCDLFGVFTVSQTTAEKHKKASV